MAIFAIYIVIFYGGAIPAHRLTDWNILLPGIYAKGAPVETVAIGAHFIAGAMLLAIGPAQILTGELRAVPRLHRVTGRIYAAAAATAGVGGLIYIAGSGTVGGTPMNLGFSLYGVSVIGTAYATYRYARLKQFERHRAWAIRLVALAIGSWLFRLDYGLWLQAVHGGGHTHDFRGPFDVVMTFFFYVPNLLIAELVIRRSSRSTTLRRTMHVVGVATTVLVVTSTYLFTRSYWWPHIADRIGIH
ncbi:MAG TPA: DUF2306 domain-containing protein [Pararobbsia sp.]|jgi:hypothetical protein|nr:DUF2306 domain-containing protein [Pararobbsia sp.]